MKLAKYCATILLLICLSPIISLAGDQQTPGCVQPSDTVQTTDTTKTVSSQTTSLGSTFDTLVVGVLNVLIGTLNP
jgi:hypothetical protein